MWDWVLTHRAQLNEIYRPAPATGRRARVSLETAEPMPIADTAPRESAENHGRRP